MKSTKFLASVAAFALAGTSAFAQGQINFFTFNNSNGGTAFGRVYTDLGMTALAGNTVTGQLYGSATADGSFTAVGSAVAFNQGVINAGNVTVAGVVAGTSYFFKLVVGGDLNKSSAVFNATLGGTAGDKVFSVPQANTFASFTTAVVPEPTTVALAGIGGLALLGLRRKTA